jgi:hypothetical protein
MKRAGTPYPSIFIGADTPDLTPGDLTTRQGRLGAMTR